ncbi:MAG: dihydrodipicolinate synthase family protein [Proteobacteria bacterium]|nr:dihydrodipicolinate synthase family protein [Pseudomonadota bacterium]
MQEFKGIFTILPLPFTEDYKINEEELYRAVDWAVKAGSQGIIATGSAAEFSHLTRDERRWLMESTLKQIRKHDGIKAMAMTAAAATFETIEYTAYAKDLGYDAALIVPPYYWKVNESEVFRHYKMISEAVDIPVVIYHNVTTSKFSISVDFAERLSTIPNIAGIKEMSTDLTFLQSLYERLGAKLNILQTFRAYLYALLLGASGGAITAFALPACVRITELLKEGNIPQAVKVQQILNGLFKGSGESSGVLGKLKVATGIASGLNFGPPRPPYNAPSAQDVETLRATYDRLNEAMK